MNLKWSISMMAMVKGCIGRGRSGEFFSGQFRGAAPIQQSGQAILARQSHEAAYESANW